MVNYGVSFPIMAKSDVNGANANEVFKFLKHEKPGMLGIEAIKWNFTKFLVDKEGNVVSRYSPTTKPESIDAGLKGPAAPGAANEFIGTRAGYMGLACAREPSAPRDVLGDALIESAKMHCRLWPVITWCRTPVSTWRTSMKLGSKAST
mgnify:CR=1 FL=1